MTRELLNTETQRHREHREFSVASAPLRLCVRNSHSPRCGDRTSVHIVTLLLWSLALFAYGINSGELYRNETLRGYLAKECLRTGDFVVPHLYGEPLLTKPPGMYVFIALCSSPFGEVTAASARLPSVIMATAAVLALYWLVSRYLPSRSAWLVSMLAPCFLLMLDKATSAETDMVLVGWVTLAIAFYDAAFSKLETSLKARSASEGPRDPSLALRASIASVAFFTAGAVCLTTGTLTKWTAGMYVYLTFILLLVWRRQLRLLVAPAHLLAIGIVTIGVGVWLTAVIQQVGWGTLKTQLWAEIAPRLFHEAHIQGHEYLHGRFEEHGSKSLLIDTLTHPLKVLGCTLPLGPLTLLTLLPGFWRRQDERTKRLLQLLHCWAWPNLLVFTLLPEHASRHSFPFCLAITSLASLWLMDWWNRLLAFSESAQAKRLRHLGLLKWSLLAFLLCWVIVKVGYVEIVVSRRDQQRQPAVKAAELAKHVPLNETLYVNQLKDEGLMFYLKRDVKRVRDWRLLPASAEAVVLTEGEWRSFEKQPPRPIQSHAYLKDSQNDTIVLIVLQPAAPS